MRRALIGVYALVAVCVTCASSVGEVVYRPTRRVSERGGFRVGLSYSLDEFDVRQHGGRPADVTSDTFLLSAAYECAALDAVLRYGLAGWDVDVNGSTADPDFGSGQAWGWGLRWRFASHREYRLEYACSIDALYGDPDSWRAGGVGPVRRPELEQYSLKIDVAREWNMVRVYTGLSYAERELRYRWAGTIGPREQRLEADQPVGVYIGTEWKLPVFPDLSVSGELRLVSSSGLTLGAIYRF